MPPLDVLPVMPAGLHHRWTTGRWAGELQHDPLPVAPRRGRVRRWAYAAAGSRDVAVGAAVVDLGLVAVGFAWLRLGRELHRFDVRRALGRGATAGRLPAHGAQLRAGDGLLRLGGDGALDLDVPSAGGRLRAAVTVGAITPMVLATTTPDGGWNVTQKAAGYRATGTVSLGGAELELDGTGWRDWTVGRQDRHTRWRWAAGGGETPDGLVGLNVSTGMNGTGPGEDVVWWKGTPMALPTSYLSPTGHDPAGDWRVGGPGWELRLETAAVRSAEERVGPFSSRYVQPVGNLTGSLPGPDGAPVPVDACPGVSEDHDAHW